MDSLLVATLEDCMFVLKGWPQFALASTDFNNHLAYKLLQSIRNIVLGRVGRKSYGKQNRNCTGGTFSWRDVSRHLRLRCPWYICWIALHLALLQCSFSSSVIPNMHFLNSGMWNEQRYLE